MNSSPHVPHPDQVAPYQPANHTGTSNRRVIGRDTVGARRLELLIGTISKGHGAQRHAHPSLEQASYLLRGAGVSEVYGQERHISAGDWGFSPKGVFHSFTVTIRTLQRPAAASQTHRMKWRRRDKSSRCRPH